MPHDREPPDGPLHDLPELEVYRELLDHIREVSRSIVDRVHDVLPEHRAEPSPRPRSPVGM